MFLFVNVCVCMCVCVCVGAGLDRLGGVLMNRIKVPSSPARPERGS